MYEAALDQVWDSFADHLAGDRMGTFLVVSAAPLGTAGRAACRKTAEALGYGPGGTVFAFLEAAGTGSDAAAADALEVAAETAVPAPATAPGMPEAADALDGGARLDAQSLFLLAEGADPLCIVCADRDAAEALSAAYRTPLALESRSNLFGRPFVAFDDFEALLKEETGKRRAWALLRTLPKFGER